MPNIIYFIKEGVRGFFQAKVMTFVSIVTIAVVLLIAGIIAVGVITVRQVFESAVEKADVVVYVNDRTAADTAALHALMATVRGLAPVNEMTLVDKAAAWERFAALYGKEMLNAVDENPLPVSIEITMKTGFQSSDAAAALTTKIETLSGVEGVRYAREWMDFLTRFRRYLYCGALALAVIMAVAFHVTISNTIRLTIYARRDVVRTMHLVGATRFFIAMPFIVEGMIQGCIGGIVSAAFFYLLRGVFVLEPSLRALPLVWGPLLLPILFILLGVIFGWIGSVFAVRKFLS